MAEINFRILFQQVQYKVNLYRSIINLSGSTAKSSGAHISTLTFPFELISNGALKLMVLLSISSIK